MNIVCFSLLCLFAGFAAAQVPAELKTAIPPPSTGMGQGTLGATVAADGGRTVVGVPLDDTGAIDAGVVAVFDSATGGLLFVIANPSPASGDQFGHCVAISGNHVVVGAPFDDSGAFEAGAAYVFDLSSSNPTTPVAVLAAPSPKSLDYFGRAVSISGNQIAIGAPAGDTGPAQSGRVIIFDISSGAPSVAATVANPTPAHADRFGASLALSGGRLVVGDPGDSFGSGSACLFDVSVATAPSLRATIANPDPAFFESFGSAVALSGDRIVVGAPMDDTGASDAGSAYVFDVSVVPFGVVTLRNPAPASAGYFGAAVAVSGSRVTVGAQGNAPSAAGNVFVYEMASVTPNVPRHSFGPGLATEGDFFGSSVAMDGRRLLVGSPFDDGQATNAGSTFVFDLDAVDPAAGPLVLRHLSAPQRGAFSQSVAVSGRWMAVGAPNDNAGASAAGAVYIYDLHIPHRTAPVLTINHPNPHASDYFGSAVALSGDRIVVGAPGVDGYSGGASDVGAAYVFDLASAEPTRFVTWWTSPTGGARFGSSVGISGDLVVIGSRETFYWQPVPGNVSLYDLSKPFYTAPTTFIGTVDSNFGASVAVSGSRVVVGAPGDDSDGPDTGRAFVFESAGPNPETPVATLRNPAPDRGDNFGSAVAISTGWVTVGAVNDFSTFAGSGRVFAFNLGRPSSPQFVLEDPTPKENGNFGLSLAIAGATVLVSDHKDDGPAISSGSAAVFDLGSANPQTPSAILNNPFPSEGDFFGQAVALGGGNAAIGAPMDDSGQENAGYAFHYGPDTTAPRFETPPAGYSPVAIYLGDTLPDFRLQAIVSDAAGATTIMQSPAPGSTQGIGKVTILLTARDAAGNESTETFEVFIEPLPAVFTAVAAKGAPVVLDTEHPAVPHGSIWTYLGSPALGESGAIALAGKWRKPGSVVSDTGLFLWSGGAASLVAKAGEDIVGIPGATWKSFGAPTISHTGVLSFLATIQGAGVTSANDSVVALADVAGLRVVAREGSAAPDCGGALLKSFTSVQPGGSHGYETAFIDAILQRGMGSPLVSGGNDRVAFRYETNPAGAVGPQLRLYVREGDSGRPGLLAGETIRSYTFLQPTPGSAGQARYTGIPLFRTSTGRDVVYGGAPLASGEFVGGDILPNTKWARLGVPTGADDILMMRASLKPGTDGVTAANATGLFYVADHDWNWDFRTGDAAPGMPAGAVFSDFAAPVIPSLGGFSAAFGGKVKGPGVTAANDEGIWWRKTGGPWTLVAREGSQPPGAPADAQWKSFTSIALSNGTHGPLFTAKLRIGAGGITAADDTALYGTGSDGFVRELVRENQTLAGRTLKTFNALTATPGSAGATRQFNTIGELIISVSFTDGGSGIVKIALP